MGNYDGYYKQAQNEIANGTHAQNTSNWSDHDRKQYEAARAQAEREAQERARQQNQRR